MTVPPVFWKKIAYFYTTDTDYSADLRVYEYTSNIKAPRLLHTEAMTSETSQRYQEYTMVSVGEFGVIFKVQGGTTWTRYVWNENTQSLDSFSPSFTDPGGLGTLTDASMTIIQVREDPENYIQKINDVTVDDINRTARKMQSSKPSVAAIGTLDELPDFHDIELGVLDKQGILPKRRKFSLFGK